ncbi:MAG: hypothetical protein M3220_10745 [Chloroflexota bacterium]|nr:hypothetical protein [Chloroflexota bacterium]
MSAAESSNAEVSNSTSSAGEGLASGGKADEGSSARPLPESYWLGQELDWDAPWEPVVLWVELPFWLMVSDCSLRVKVNGHEFQVDVQGSFVELYAGEVLDSRRTAVYVGPNPEHLNPELRQELERENISTLPRPCRSVLRIHSRCNGDVLAAVQEDNRRARTAHSYLMALCEAHFEVVNRVIQGYRLSTYDYFPYEVSPWDIPIWRIDTAWGFDLVALLPYATWDRKPMIGPMGGLAETYTLIEPVALQDGLLAEANAGELELLDALNFMERGDYTGAVRRITTAIEAIVESVLRVELLKRHSVSDVERRLHASRNDFPGRVRQYQKLSGSDLDHQLRKELDSTRALRHEIVHRGRRITFADRGLAHRAVDTGRWIFNWFEDQPDRAVLRERRIGVRSIGRHFSYFDAEITPEGVVVQKPPSFEDDLTDRHIAE